MLRMKIVLAFLGAVLSLYAMLDRSLLFAQDLQPQPDQLENEELVEEQANKAKMHKAWELAVRYRFEELVEEQEIAHDPDIIRDIAGLRGDDLGYFLDLIEAINQVETTVFTPISLDSLDSAEAVSITISEERKLVEIVIANIFSNKIANVDLTKLSGHEIAYLEALQPVLNTIAQGRGDLIFPENYLAYRTGIISFIEDTDAELFSFSQETIDNYLKYFNITDKELVDLNPNRTDVQIYAPTSCSTTNTIDNWPAKSSTYSGNTGSAWYEGKASDQSDCDIWVRYYMGPTVHYGRVSAGTSAAQCVLDKTSQLRGDWSGSNVYNYVQYGKVTVTWWWPFGCNTTGSALMSATKWRP